MTISIGGMGSQPRTEFTESPVDRVTSSENNQKAREGTDTPTTETTTLLAGTTSLAALTSAAVETSGVRTDKIEQLRQAIAGGTYQVDPSQVADAMLKEWQSRP
ncbi:MAG: flagellar biosynthesis anti-sigma factor FlgM [Terriglobales bacterium]